jgi:sugar/nucleoside kinase (ribokinase family)
VEGGERVQVPASPVDTIVDTTGAGDQFAAGFLVAHCRKRPLKACLEAGAIAAAEVISHFGARPEANVAKLIGL